jgi:hypothetical protein
MSAALRFGHGGGGMDARRPCSPKAATCFALNDSPGPAGSWPAPSDVRCATVSAMYTLHQLHLSAILNLMPTPRSTKAGKVSVSARVPPEVAEELDRMASAIRPRPTRSQMVSMALQDWLKSKPVRRGWAKGMP